MTLPTLSFTIRGLHCGACAARAQNALNALDDVTQAHVNLATHTATLTLAPQALPDTVTARAVATIERLGFALESTLQDSPDADIRAGWRSREADAVAHITALRRRVLSMSVCAVPLFIFSMGHMLGLYTPAPIYAALFQCALTLPVVCWGRDFYISGLRALMRGVPNMDSLVALGTGAAFVYSVWQTVYIIVDTATAESRALDLYYESCAVLLTMITLGRYLEAFSRQRATDALGALLRCVPETALRLDPVHNTSLFAQVAPVEVPVAQLRVNDVVLIKPGSRVPTDGVVVDGASSVDISLLTGESLPVPVHVGDTLTGGSVNAEGVLTMKVVRVGRNTTLARIVRLVQEAQSSKAPMARLADQVSAYFVPAVLALALMSGLLWFTVGQESASFALRIVVTVLVIACPCALGLATPMSVMVATGRAAQLGVLIKNGAVLEQAARLNVLAFDKTGTLTTGMPRLTNTLSLHTLLPETLLSVALALETRSEHPLARALMAEGAERGVQPLPVHDVVILPGMGLRGTVEMHGVRVPTVLGNQACMSRCGIALDNADILETAWLKNNPEGATLLFLALDGRLEGIFCMADVPRPETAAVIARLRALGIRLLMVSGDNERAAHAVARQVGIDEVYAGVLPHEKERVLAQIKAQLKSPNMRVGMVGDGINDAPALASADVGIVVGNGVDVSVEAGDIVLMRGGMETVLTALRIARATLGNMKQNLLWAFGYNVLGLPVAAGLLHIFGGPTLSPMLAGTAMALSSVSVVCNALRLRRVS